MRHTAPILAAFALGLSLLFTSSRTIAQTDDRVEIDRIVALIETSSSDEGASVPILASDVALQARLDLARAHGNSWKDIPIDKTVSTIALRTLVLTRWAARQARQMGVETNPAGREAIRSDLIENVGGIDQMNDLLSSAGARMQDLDRWIDDSRLAIEQLGYFRERIEPPTDKTLARAFASDGHPFVGQKLSDVRARFRRYYLDGMVRRSLAVFLNEAVDQGVIRFLK